MSALPDLSPVFRVMRTDELDAVCRIENDIYPFPWTRGNFADSITAGYRCRVMECGRAMAGYGVLMVGAGESHLLNLSVAQGWQRRGLGRELVLHLAGIARDEASTLMLLEVRPSNLAARALYETLGFAYISVRRGYYPAADGREDAIVLGLKL